jgi:hypothetical protein
MPLPQQRAFRFGVALRAAASRREWIEKCRKAEDIWKPWPRSSSYCADDTAAR